MSSAVDTVPVFPTEAAPCKSKVLKILWMPQSMWEKEKGLFCTLLQALSNRMDSLAPDAKYSTIF